MKHFLVFLLLLAFLSPVPNTTRSADGTILSPRAPALLPQDLQDMKLLGHVGGTPKAVEAAGSWLYATFGRELSILDISNPAQPVRVGYVLVEDPILDIAIQGGYAYLALGGSGVSVVDVSDPADPVEIPRPIDGYASSWAGKVQAQEGVLITGNLYQTTEHVLGIYDLANPEQPSLVGEWPAENEPYSVIDFVSSGSTVFVVGQVSFQTDYFAVLDITNPHAPVPVFGPVEADEYWSVAVQGTHLYLAGYADASQSWGLQVVDIADPTQPVFKSFTSLSGGWTRTMHLSGSLAYVGSDEQLNIVDISDPEAPEWLSSWPEMYFDIAVSGQNVYGVDTYFDSWHSTLYFTNIQILDLTDPSAPQLSGIYEPFPQVPLSLAAAGDLIFAGSYGKFLALDATDRHLPIPIGELNLDDPILNMEVDGNLAYLVTDRGLKIVDISTTSAPILLGTLNLDPLYAYHSRQLAKSNNHVYISNNLAGSLDIVDVSSPVSPTLVITLPMGGSFNDIEIEGSLVLFTSGNSLNLLDITNPTSPTLLGGLALTQDGTASGVAVAGNHAYVTVTMAFAGKELHIVDISQPTSPAEAGVLPVLSASADMFVSDERLYLGMDSNGMQIFDISDPLNPIELAGYLLPEFSFGLGRTFVQNGTVYLASGSGNGLFLLRYSGLSINGRVLQANRLPVEGVEISNGISQTLSTLRYGFYRFEDLAAGNYSITPGLAGRVFLPQDRTVQLAPSTYGQDFTLLPAPVSTSIEPGLLGSLAYTDTQGLPTSLSFPAGIFNQTVDVTITPTLAAASSGWFFSGHAFDIVVDHSLEVTFTVPATLTVQYSNWDARLATDESGLTIFRWNGEDWQEAAGTCSPAGGYTRELEANTLSLPVCQAGRYALFVPVWTRYLPVVATNSPPF